METYKNTQRHSSYKPSTEMDALKIPPHSIEAEQAVLGGLMLDNRAWDLIADRVREHDFYRHDHRLIYSVMATATHQNRPLDVLTVCEALKELHELDNAGGEVYLYQLANNTPSVANIAA